MIAAFLPCLVLLTANPPHEYVYFERDREQISDPTFLETKRFEGAQIKYVWRELEPEPGKYDFTNIKADLDFLTKRGKRLFIQLQDSSFAAASVLTPNYLRTDPKYHGGDARQYNDDGTAPEGWVSRRWDPAVQDRLKGLYQALGKAFDGKIAGINLPETAINVEPKSGELPQGFTYEKYRDAIIKNMIALKAAFPKSVVMQYANFMPGEWLPDEDKGYLKSVFEAGAKYNVAMGGPDLMPFRYGQQEHSYAQMRRLKGKLITGIAVQEGNYGDIDRKTKKTMSIPELRDYAIQNLGVSYIFWCREEPFYSKQLVPFMKGLK